MQWLIYRDTSFASLLPSECTILVAQNRLEYRQSPIHNLTSFINRGIHHPTPPWKNHHYAWCWYAIPQITCYSDVSLAIYFLNFVSTIFRFSDFTGHRLTIESLSKRRFCQHGQQPEVSSVVIDGESWRQPFPFEIMNVKVID